MKQVLCFALLLSTSVFAREQTAVNDPQYQPLAGTIFGDTSYNHLKFSDTVNVSGTDVKFGINGNFINQVIGYAPADNFSIFGTFGYSNIESSEGLSDIALNAKYRLLNTDYRWDLIGGVSISPEDDETKSNGESNAFTGGHAINIGTEYGHRTTARTWSVFGTLNYNLEKTSKDKTSTDTKVVEDPYMSLLLGAKLYTPLFGNNGIRTIASVQFDQEYEDDSSPKNTTAGSTNYILGAEYQHVLNQNLYLRGGFDSAIAGSGESSVVMLYHLGAGYQF